MNEANKILAYLACILVGVYWKVEHVEDGSASRGLWMVHDGSAKKGVATEHDWEGYLD